MNDNAGNPHRTTIVVALIGLAGTLGTAYIGYMATRDGASLSAPTHNGSTQSGNVADSNNLQSRSADFSVEGRWVPANGSPGDVTFVEEAGQLRAFGSFYYGQQGFLFDGVGKLSGNRVSWSGASHTLLGRQAWSCSGEIQPGDNLIRGYCQMTTGTVDIEIERVR